MDSFNSFVNHGCFPQPTPEFPTSWSNFLITWGDGTVESKKMDVCFSIQPFKISVFTRVLPRYSSGARLWVFWEETNAQCRRQFHIGNSSQLSSLEGTLCVVGPPETPSFMVTFPSKTAWQLPRRKDTWLSMVIETTAPYGMIQSNLDIVRVSSFPGCVGMNVSVKLRNSCVSYFMVMSLAFASGLFIFMPFPSIQFCPTTNLTSLTLSNNNCVVSTWLR